MTLPVWDMGVLGIAFVNIILTVILVYVFYKNHVLIKSKITAGMLFFAGAFLLENIMNFFFYESIISSGVLGITTFQLGVNIIEMAGLIVLLYVTWR